MNNLDDTIRILTVKEPLVESNCYLLVKNQHVLIVDPNCGEEIVTRIRNENLVGDGILLTHEHCDHIGGLNEVRKSLHVPVICTVDCSKNIQDVRKNMSSLMEVYVYFRTGKRITYEPFCADPAEVIFRERLERNWQDCKISGTRVPGHTVGSCIYKIEDTGNVCYFTGDYLIQKEQVITGLQAGDPDGYETIGRQMLLSLPGGAHLYPGHGPDYYLDQQGSWKHGL